MRDEDKTKEQLLDELRVMGQRLTKLEAAGSKARDAGWTPWSGEEQQIGFLTTVLEHLTPPFFCVIDANDYSVIKTNLTSGLDLPDGKQTCYALSHHRNEPCDSVEHPCPLKEVKRTRKSVVVEHVHYNNDGNERYVEVHAHPIFDGQGNIMQMIECGIDVTDRKEADSALLESERLLKTIVSTAPIAIAMGRQRDFVWVNDGFLRMFGFENEAECVGQNTRIIYSSEEEYQRIGKLLLADLESGGVNEVEARCRRNDDSVFDALIRIKALDPMDTAKGVIATATDISDRKRAESANEKYRAVVDHAREGICVAQDGVFRFVNPRITEILGYSEEELTGRSFGEYIHPDDRGMVLERHLRRLRGEQLPTSYDFRVVDRNGSVKWIEVDSTMIEWEGRPASLAFMIDITERKQLDLALIEQRKEPSKLVVPRVYSGQHESRDTYSYERRDWHDPAGSQYRADR